MRFDFSGISPENAMDAWGESALRRAYPLTLLTDGNTKLGGADLGYKAVKYFYKPNDSNQDEFYILSENGYLNNNPDNFPYGQNCWYSYFITSFSINTF